MVQARYSTRAAEVATQLGIRTPKVKFTRLLPTRWYPEGIVAYAVWLRPIIVITPAFDNYSSAERDSQLAHWLVQADLARTTLFKFVGAALLFTVLTFVPLSVHGTLAGHPFAFTYIGLLVDIVRMPRDMFWLAETVWLAAILAASVAWGRRIVYRADRRVADVLGPSAMNDVLRVGRHVRYLRRGIIGMYLNLFIPSEAKRADAISCFPRTAAVNGQTLRLDGQP